uniref:LOX n=1 Tax=Arundo donax TaxID=35708 RepID=A0A0A9BNV8_ARUDO
MSSKESNSPGERST